MVEDESLSHTLRVCKYHVIFIRAYRRKALYGDLRRHIGEVFRELAAQEEASIEENPLIPDHVHVISAIPPQSAMIEVLGYIKGKSAIHLARVYSERQRNFVGQHFWADGYFVSTVGRDKKMIRDYIRNEEPDDVRLEQLKPMAFPGDTYSIQIARLIYPGQSRQQITFIRSKSRGLRLLR
jgi:putative transposase